MTHSARFVCAILTCLALQGSPARTAEPVSRPTFVFPIRVEGVRLVAADGRVWPAFGRSEFALAWHGYHDRWTLVDQLLDRDRAEGFTYVRVFGMLSWLEPTWEPWSDPERYWRAWDELANRARERNLVVWFTVFADWNRLAGVSPARFADTAHRAASYARRHANVVVEIANEWYVNGLSPEQVREAGAIIRSAGYEGILFGSTPDHAETPRSGELASGEATRLVTGPPFNAVTLHSRRDDGHGGWEHVKEIRDAIAFAESMRKPIVLGEPMGFDFRPRQGIYDDSPVRALGAMLAAWIGGASGYCYHADGGLWSKLEGYPGEDLMRVFWTLPLATNPGAWTFVNGHWPDAPITSATGFLGEPTVARGPYRIYGATSSSGDYVAIAFGGRPPWTLKAQRTVDLQRYGENGRLIDPKPVSLKPGDVLQERGRDLLILVGKLRGS